MTSAITDFTQYHQMRADAGQNDPGVLREVAGQFEALFVQTLLKNMRDSSLGDPIFGQSDQFEMYQGMLDQQFAAEMSSGRGIGIADMLVQQLGGEVANIPTTPDVAQWSPPAPLQRQLQDGVVARQANGSASSPGNARWDSPADFAREVWPHAELAGRKLGVAPESLLAQAALETGWGEHVMKRTDGGSSFNIFGIKAGQTWDGASVVKNTLEFKDGIAYRDVARFRAYPNIAATFEDYASFIGDKPRYASVVGSGQNAGHFAGALQDAGYATDPRYAEKIERILNGDTMQGALQSLQSDPMSPITQMTTPVSSR